MQIIIEKNACYGTGYQARFANTILNERPYQLQNLVASIIGIIEENDEVESLIVEVIA